MIIDKSVTSSAAANSFLFNPIISNFSTSSKSVDVKGSGILCIMSTKIVLSIERNATRPFASGGAAIVQQRVQMETMTRRSLLILVTIEQRHRGSGGTPQARIRDILAKPGVHIQSGSGVRDRSEGLVGVDILPCFKRVEVDEQLVEGIAAAIIVVPPGSPSRHCSVDPRKQSRPFGNVLTQHPVEIVLEVLRGESRCFQSCLDARVLAPEHTHLFSQSLGLGVQLVEVSYSLAVRARGLRLGDHRSGWINLQRCCNWMGQSLKNLQVSLQLVYYDIKLLV